MKLGPFRLRTLLLWLLVPVPAVMMGLQRPQTINAGVRIIDIIAAVPEAGGFQPDSIDVRAGETVLLRFYAADVAHGIAIGPGLGVDLGDAAPGTRKDVLLTFEEAGTFTFYCNKWCSTNHWRMRGVIAVTGGRQAPPAPQRDPVIDALLAEGIDIDAMVDAAHGSQPAPAATLATTPPSAARGALLAERLQVPADLREKAWQRTHTPQEGMALLLAANPASQPQELADAIAYLWVAGSEPASLQDAGTLYTKNCAACHGDNGGGDGIGAGTLPQPPPSFQDPAHMAARRGDVLYAKIRRGGMGTGMPNFGTVFTTDETWALVDHLWKLAFDAPVHQ